MNPRFLEACLAEIGEALDWYQYQSPELPDRILTDLQNTVRKLAPFPESFRVVIDPYRKINLKIFPYALFFRIDPEEIVIVGFFHLQSDPKKWARVLETR